jgi:hypothetical protein
MDKLHPKDNLDASDLLLLAVIAALILAACSTADAQTRPISPAVALARICVSEADWQCFDRGDGYAIHEVILRGAARQRMSYVGFARAYAGATLGKRAYAPTSPRQWVAELAEDGSAPAHWPTAPRLSGPRGGVVRMVPATPWSSFRARWLAVLAKAREVVQRTLEDVRGWSPCAGEVEDWGGDMDHHRAVRLGLIPVSCGNTANDFYRRP